jgi:hypothetical protein
MSAVRRSRPIPLCTEMSRLATSQLGTKGNRARRRHSFFLGLAEARFRAAVCHAEVTAPRPHPQHCERRTLSARNGGAARA